MTVFKTFLKIVIQYKGTILLYSIILLAFAGISFQTGDSSTDFTATKPSVLIVNKDEEVGLTENLIKYIEKNSEIKEIETNEDSISDALFYREVNYVIYIPENYRKDFLNGENPEIEIKSNGTYESSLAEMMLSRYIKVANVYRSSNNSEENLISQMNQTLEKETSVSITSKLDTTKLEKTAFYYNFLNYSMLAGTVYVICLILSSFKDEKIKKRTSISSMNYKKHNRQLLLSNGVLSIILWIFYVALSFILVGDVMTTAHGILFIINSFFFSICCLTIAFLIGTILSNKNAINGIVNVISLGSSFLAGAFVPAEFLPNSVLTIARILPSYWYINSNNLIKTLEVINFETLKPMILNISIIVIFSLVFVTVTNIVSKKVNG